MQSEFCKGYVNTCSTVTRNFSEMIGLSGAETTSYKFSFKKRKAYSFANLIIWFKKKIWNLISRNLPTGDKDTKDKMWFALLEKIQPEATPTWLISIHLFNEKFCLLFKKNALFMTRHLVAQTHQNFSPSWNSWFLFQMEVFILMKEMKLEDAGSFFIHSSVNSFFFHRLLPWYSQTADQMLNEIKLKVASGRLVIWNNCANAN